MLGSRPPPAAFRKAVGSHSQMTSLTHLIGSQRSLPSSMKLLRFCCTLLLTGLALASVVPAHAAPDARVYELRTYTATPGSLDKLLARFREHTVKLFEKHGMTNVGYWMPMDEKDGAADKLVYLLS